MDIPFRRDEDNYVYLTDRFGEPSDGVDLTPEDEKAIETYAKFFQDQNEARESFFLVRKRNGTGPGAGYGFLMEVIEVPHDEMTVPSDDRLTDYVPLTIAGRHYPSVTTRPPLADVVADLQNHASEIGDQFPGLELEVALDPACFDEAVVIRGFIPEDTELTADMNRIANAFFEVGEKLRTAPAPAPSPM